MLKRLPTQEDIKKILGEYGPCTETELRDFLDDRSIAAVHAGLYKLKENGIVVQVDKNYMLANAPPRAERDNAKTQVQPKIQAQSQSSPMPEDVSAIEVGSAIITIIDNLRADNNRLRLALEDCERCLADNKVMHERIITLTTEVNHLKDAASKKLKL